MNTGAFLISVLLTGAFCAANAQLTQTNLPIIVITAATVADTQAPGNLKIIDNGTGNNQPGDAAAFQGDIGIKYRGSSTYPKRSYNIETWTNIPKVSLDTSLLGMPSENDWVLLACYTDRSFLRDLTGFRLWEQMGHYAPRMRPVEVILNNTYQGIYLFGEKIKRDDQRLDIANLKITDAAPPEITGGYIFRIDNSNDDSWASSIAPPYAQAGQTINFHYEEPSDEDITPVQKNYIKTYVDSFETALQGPDYQDTLLGWRNYAGHNSFEDYLLISEVLKSEDAYRLSTYLYKDKNKKLRAGPLWDLELSLYNTANCDASKDTGWAYHHGAVCGSDVFLPPFWWERLVTDTAYMNAVKCKYTHLRSTLLDTVSIYSFIDSISALLNVQQAAARNFTQWPTFGTSIVNEPLPLSTDYNDELAKLKGFIKRRLQYLDSKWLMPGCTLSVLPLTGEQASVSIYPNPAGETVHVQIHLKKTTGARLVMRNIQGSIVREIFYKQLQAGGHSFRYSITDLPAGFYTVTVFTGPSYTGTYKLIKQ